MKKVFIVCLAAMAALIAGCVVTSVSPYYSQRDLVFEPAILGNWTSMDTPTEVWRFEQNGELAYRFTLIEASKATVMDAHMFKLSGKLFLDVYSLEQDYHVIPAHYLLRISSLTPILQFAELNDLWLKELLDKEPTAVRHHFVQMGDKPEERRVVLTGETSELQRFVTAQLNNKRAWKTCVELRRDLTLRETAQAK